MAYSSSLFKGTTANTSNASNTKSLFAGSTKAPAGYVWDPVQKQYVRQVGSAQDTLAQRQRGQDIEDQRIADTRYQQGIERTRQANEDNYKKAYRASHGTDYSRKTDESSDGITTQQAVNARQAQAQNTASTAATSSTAAASDERKRRLQQMIEDLMNQTDTSSVSAYKDEEAKNTARETYTGTSDLNAEMQAARAAQSAEFANAKASAGALGRGALQSLRSELAGRGILRSGTEARGTVDRLAGATNPLAQMQAAQLREMTGITEHAQDRAQHAADVRYQGDISQRGQDYENQNSYNQRRLSARSQDLSAEESRKARKQRYLDQLNSLVQSY